MAFRFGNKITYNAMQEEIIRAQYGIKVFDNPKYMLSFTSNFFIHGK